MVPASEVAIVLQRNNTTVKVNTIWKNEMLTAMTRNIQFEEYESNFDSHAF